MANSKIDNLTFVRLSAVGAGRGGAPSLTQQWTEIEQRPGVDGLSVLLLGEKGVPFQMESGVDVDDLSAAMDALSSYHEKVGQVVDVVWNGVNFTATHQTKYVVITPLETVAPIRMTAARGGISTGKQYWVSALWTLIPIKVE